MQIKNLHIFLIISGCLGMLKSVFDLAGIALSMQAIISVIANGRMEKLLYKLSEEYTLGLSLKPKDVTIIIIVIMSFAFLLSIVVEKINIRVKKSLYKKIFDENQNLQKPRDINKAARQTEIYCKLLEFLFFIIIVLILLSYISPLFAFFCLLILLIYGVFVMQNLKISRVNKVNGVQADQFEKNRSAKNKVEAAKIDVIHQMVLTRNSNIKSSGLSFTAIIAFVIVTSNLIEPGELFIMPILLILALRKILGSAKQIATNIFKLRSFDEYV